MSNTIRNPNTRKSIENNSNGFPNVQSKRERYVDMSIVQGTMLPRINEHWRN